MKREYLNDVLDALKTVSALRWIDADEGQLDYYNDGERPPVAFPCCLVELGIPGVQPLSELGAEGPCRCILRATLQVAFDDCATLEARTPTSVREVAFRRFDLLEEVRRALDGRWLEGALQPWTRTSCMPRKRDDGLKLYEMVFEAGIIED